MTNKPTIRNHYNPCSWAALWNEDYFNSVASRGEVGSKARDQVIHALNVRADGVLTTKADSVYFEKYLGLAEISPESLRSFVSRWYPDELERVTSDLSTEHATVFLDFEEILSGVERTAAYTTLLDVAKRGDIVSVEEKGFLACWMVLHAMRGYEFMSDMVERAAEPASIPKWEHLWLLKHAWSDPVILGRAVLPLADATWTLFRTTEHQVPLCDSPIMIRPHSVVAILSPRLILEIDMRVSRGERNWQVHEGISSAKLHEFRALWIRNTFKDLVFPDRDVLEATRRSTEYKRHARLLSTSRGRALAIREGATRVRWLVNGMRR